MAHSSIPRPYKVAAVSLCGLLMLVFNTALHAQESAQAQGAALLSPFKKDLMAALKSGLAEGLDEAIAACNTEAPGIAARYSVEGVQLGRASHRLRNPANAAPEWVAPVLDEYLASDATREARVVAIGDGRTGYIEPIMVAPQCLGCHGETLSPEVSARLQALYPEDQATGFAVGDLRGVFWVAYP